MFSKVFVTGGFYCVRHSGVVVKPTVDMMVGTGAMTPKQGDAFSAWVSHTDVVAWRADGKSLSKALGDLVHSTTVIGLVGYYCAHRETDLPEVLSPDDVTTWLIEALPDQLVLSAVDCARFLAWANDKEVRLWRAAGRGLYDGLREEGTIPNAGSPWKE